MPIQITIDQANVCSGTLTINASAYRDAASYLNQLYGYQRQPNTINLGHRMYRPVQVYDYAPFAIVKTDHDSFMSIEALEYDDNVYPAGKRLFPYCPKRLQKWLGAFEYMRPYKTKMTTVWKCVSHRPLDCKSLLNQPKEQQ